MAEMQNKKRIMLYKDAAPLVGLSVSELYKGLRSGKWPGCQVGSSKHGKWIVDLDLIEVRMRELMEKNMKQQEETSEVVPYSKIRRISG